uniref:Uncharacterized protein n=1 Tax=Avena sativa TaxID=4498 RepID=A0ACD5TVT5_AVESA
MMVGMEEDARMAAAAAPGSECSSGCQSGWTTYLDDDRSSYSYTYDTARLHGLPPQPCYGYGCDYSEEEDDLSMVSDASSGPRQQHSAGSDEGAAALANARAVRRGSRMAEPAAARRQSKMSAAAAASNLLEDTASSPAFFKHSKVMSSPEGSGYGGAAGSMMEMSSAADFPCAFLATTGYEFEVRVIVKRHLTPY